MSLSTPIAPSWYSDMSTRIIFFASPKSASATALASSVLPTPVGPRKSSTPSGRSNPSLSGPLFRIRRRETARTASRWPTTRAPSRSSRSLNRSETSRNTMSSRDPGGGRHDRRDVRAADLRSAVDLGAHGGGVEPADGLVRQPQVPQVARRHVQRHLDSVVVDADAVVAFEPRADVLQNPARLLDGRLGDEHRTEASGECLVVLDELLVLAERRRADDADLAAREHALEDVGRVRRRAERRTGADERVRLVDEQDQVRALAQFAQHVLHAVLEHASQHRPGHQAVELQADDVAVAEADRQGLGLELDAARESLGNRGLAHAGLAEEHHGVGALAVAQHFDGLLNLGVAPVHQGQLVLACQQVEVRREVLQERRQLVALLQPLVLALDFLHARGDAAHHASRARCRRVESRSRAAPACPRRSRQAGPRSRWPDGRRAWRGERPA